MMPQDKPIVMRLQDSDESKRDARDSQKVEHGVEQFVPDATAATTRSVEQHGWKEKLFAKLKNIVNNVHFYWRQYLVRRSR